MRKLTQLLLLLTFGLLLHWHGASLVYANTAPVQFRIPNTKLTVAGFASPKAFVQIIDGGALIGTVVADANGRFEKVFPAMKAGLHNLQFKYDDQDGNPSDTLSQTINVRAQSDTAVEYYLPPTIRMDAVSIIEGELLSFSGSTLPNAFVEINIDGGNLVLRPQADANGRYAISIDTTGYYFGEHTLIARAQQGGLTSFETLRKAFIVLPIGSDSDNQVSPGDLTPPTIELTDGIIETDISPTLLRGTAPPNTQIIIYVDGEPVGSTFSNADGFWFFNVQITKKSHEVRAVACIGEVCSEFSNLARIVFTGDLEACAATRFWLLEYRFWNISEGDGLNLNVTGVSGTPPFDVLIDWGDSVTEQFNRDSSQSMRIHHIYERSGQYNGRLTFADDNGCEYTRYFSVGVIDADERRNWLFGVIPGTLIAIFLLRRRYGIRRKKLILAR